MSTGDTKSAMRLRQQYAKTAVSSLYMYVQIKFIIDWTQKIQQYLCLCAWLEL